MSLEAELKKWMADPKNKKRIADAKAKKLKAGQYRGYFSVGGSVKTPNFYAEELRQCIYERIPISLKTKSKHPIDINDIIISQPKVLKDGSIQINLSFAPDAIHRDSLDPEIHDGKYEDGVDNIISLFVKGYTAHGDVSGMWHDRMILNKLHRDATPFMQKAVDDFLSRHGGVAQVTLPEDYKA